MTTVSRRRFVQGAGLAGAGLLTGCGRLPWQGEPPAKAPRIGIISLVTTDPSDADNAALRQGLRDLGYAEGQNITLEWRSPSSGSDQFPALAAELVGLSVDLIVTQGNGPSQAAKRASATIPIVMAYSPDPVRAGLIASLARPGGNVTGLATMTGELGGKRLELLRYAVPRLARVAMLWDPEATGRAYEFEETAAAAWALGLGLQSVALRHGEDLESAFANILQGRGEALVLQPNPVTIRYRAEIGEFAAAHRLPTIASRRDSVEAGSLMSYGPNIPDMNRRAAVYVDKILRGTKPTDLPVEQPMRFDFVVNMKTARELGITFPNEILLQVTEVIDS